MLFKKRLFISISAFFIATTFMALCLPNNVFAASLTESKKLYNAVIKKIENIESQIEKLDSQITDTMSDIDETNEKINISKKTIEKTESDIKTIQTNIKEEQIIFGERMEALYVNGSTSYIDVLFESEDFTDFISRIDTVKTIINHDQEVMTNLDKQKNSLSEKKESLEKEQYRLVSLEKESSSKLASLNNKKKEQNSLIVSLKNEKNTYASEIKAYEAEIARALEISKKQETKSDTPKVKNNSEAITKSVIKTDTKTNETKNDTKLNKITILNNNNTTNSKTDLPSRGDTETPESSSNASATSVVSYARKFLGTPYVWGGSTPSGFDCSGLTSYVFRNAAGISLPRTAAAQAGVGSTVSRANLQSGDLVFFGGSSITHVGIYTGNGNYIHSPRTGDVVKEVPMIRNDFKFGKRI